MVSSSIFITSFSFVFLQFTSSESLFLSLTVGTYLFGWVWKSQRPAGKRMMFFETLLFVLYLSCFIRVVLLLKIVSMLLIHVPM